VIVLSIAFLRGRVSWGKSKTGINCKGPKWGGSGKGDETKVNETKKMGNSRRKVGVLFWPIGGGGGGEGGGRRSARHKVGEK